MIREWYATPLSFPVAPVGTPCPPYTAVSSFIKWGWCFHRGLGPSYLTDILWGFMKLCLQCFQFLEKNYLWTFQVLYRYISDLSFLFAIILVCCFYLFYKMTVNIIVTSDSYQSSELPSHVPDWCRVNCSGTRKNVLPSDWKGGPGHRSHRGASGSRLGWHTMDARALIADDLWPSHPEVSEE